MRVCTSVAILLLAVGGAIGRQSASADHVCETKAESARYDGAPWSLKGAGVVCCPCRVPCPCRQNGPPSYGHCEATLYLHIEEGRYRAIDLAGLRMVDSGGACSMTYHTLSALYFDGAASPEKRSAMLKLIASMFFGGVAEFSNVRLTRFDVSEIGGRIFRISIPRIVSMEVDRNWGQQNPPFPWVAAVDHFSNALQYAENIQYKIHDPAAKIDFDYSHRQANFREVNLTNEDYATKRMLIQYMDGTGRFNEAQTKLIQELGLSPPDSIALSQLARNLRSK